MSMKLDAGKDIYTMLSANETISSTTSNHIFPIIADDDTPTPYIVYRRTSTNFETNKDFITKSDDTVELLVVTDDYKEGVGIAEAAMSALMDYNIASLGIKRVTVVGGNEDYNEGKYIQTLIINIKY